MHPLNLKKKPQMKMKIKRGHTVFLIVVLFWSDLSSAQANSSKDSLDTQLVKVVKAYTPKISDAFKLKQLPFFEDQKNVSKTPVEYTIFSIPVASTFTPAKSKSLGLEQLKKEKRFNSIVSLSGGNYTSIHGDLFLNKPIAKGKNLSAFLSHQSSQGGIKDVFLDDGFSTNIAQFKYAVDQRSFDWNAGVSAQRFMTQWYGWSPQFNITQTPFFDTQQVVSVFEAKANLNLNEGILKSAQTNIYHLSDHFDSNEIRAQLGTNLNFTVLNTSIFTHLNIDFLKGNFEQNDNATPSIDFGNFMASLSPTYKFERPNLIFNIGFKTVYFNDTERSKQKIYFYPKIKATYTIIDSILIAYAGAEGDLTQNTYRDLYATNSFVSPTLNIRPTTMPYKLFLGTKGKLTNSLSYDVSGIFSRQADAVFFQKNILQTTLAQQPYDNGNSFSLVYDDLETFSINGSLFFQVNNSFNFSAGASFNSYSLKLEEKAWNLPQIEMSFGIRYRPTERLNLGVQGFYQGSRHDLEKQTLLPTNTYQEKQIELDSFFDLNIDTTYELTPRWSAFLKLNNILGKNYQRWMDYPVQGFQVSAGALYKFDF